jgi:hypothetical protein
MVRIGNKPPLMNSSLFRRFTQCSIAFGNVFLPHRPQMPDSGRRIGHLIAVYCLAEERKKLRAGKRRSEDLMSGRIRLPTILVGIRAAGLGAPITLCHWRAALATRTSHTWPIEASRGPWRVLRAPATWNSVLQHWRATYLNGA